MGKNYAWEDNQACKPQEEEKKRGEAASTIKKRDVKQATKILYSKSQQLEREANGKDQEVPCLGQSSDVIDKSCGGEAVDTGKVLSESR